MDKVHYYNEYARGVQDGVHGRRNNKDGCKEYRHGYEDGQHAWNELMYRAMLRLKILPKNH